jgi:hypothetical protein
MEHLTPDQRAFDEQGTAQAVDFDFAEVSRRLGEFEPDDRALAGDCLAVLFGWISVASDFGPGRLVPELRNGSNSLPGNSQRSGAFTPLPPAWFLAFDQPSRDGR